MMDLIRVIRITILSKKKYIYIELRFMFVQKSKLGGVVGVGDPVIRKKDYNICDVCVIDGLSGPHHDRK